MGNRLLLNIREAYYGCHVTVAENALSTIQWEQRNIDGIMMDSFPNSNHRQSTALTTFPEFDREERAEGLQPSPSSSTGVKSRPKVTFDNPYTP